LLGSILWSSHGSVLIDPNFYLNLLLFEKGAGITFVISSYLECIILTFDSQSIYGTRRLHESEVHNGTKFLQSIIHPGRTESSEITLADIETHYIRKFWWDSNFISNYAHIKTLNFNRWHILTVNLQAGSNIQSLGNSQSKVGKLQMQSF
jgi:hypothetical protein